jgi:hypothetical protein
MYLRRVLLAGSSAVIIFASLAIATAQTSPNDNFGFIRFIHTAIDVSPIDLYTIDSPTPIVSSLAYGQFTDFLTLSTSTQGFVARRAGAAPDSPPLFRLSRRVKANQSEIITAAGLDSKRAFVLEPLVLIRSATRGKARVRVFNTVWGGPYLTVKDQRSVVYGQDLQYLSSSIDSDVEPGSYEFSVFSGAGKVVATEPGVTLEADKVYSLMLVGGMDGAPPIHFIVLVCDEESTRVRIINAGGNPADIYIKGIDQPFVSNLKPGASTPYITVPSGATTFVLRPAGSAANSTEYAFVAPQLRPGRDVTITINGSGVATQMGMTDDRLTPLIAATAAATP